jgi:glycosyltransferase involved in cell wall biosynthesis
MSDVAVIVPCYNYGRFVSRAIDSVLRQTLPPREIIVIDDGSTDDSREVLARFGADIRLVLQENRGVAASRNRGIALSSAPLVAFLDADDAWLPNKLERQVGALARHPDVGLVHCGMAYVDVAGEIIGVRLEGGNGRVDSFELLTRLPVLGGGSGALIPRPVLADVGGFDERLSTSADWDLYLRIALRYPIWFVPEMLLHYTLHNSNMHRNVAAMEHDQLLTYQKIVDGPSSPLTNSRLRRRAYSELHLTLSGSYYQTGEWYHAVVNGIRACLYWPPSAAYIVQLPRRVFDRRRPSQYGLRGTE